MDQRSSEVSVEMPEEYLSSEENRLHFMWTKLLEYEKAIDNPPNLSLISAKPDSSKKEDSSSLRTWNDVSLVMKETKDYRVDFYSQLSKFSRGIEEFPIPNGIRAIEEFPIPNGIRAIAPNGIRAIAPNGIRAIEEFPIPNGIRATYSLMRPSNYEFHKVFQSFDFMSSDFRKSAKHVHEHNWCSHCNSFTEIWSNNFAEQTKYSCKSCHKFWTHPLDKIEVPVKNWLDRIAQAPSANTYSAMNDICINIDNPNMVNHIISVHHVRLEQERSTDSGLKLAELVLGITGQAAFSLLGYSLTSSSSPALAFVVGANAVGFIGTLTAILLRRKKQVASGIARKIGAIAAASGIVVAMGMFLPEKFVWTSGIACLIPAVAVVAFA